MTAFLQGPGEGGGQSDDCWCPCYPVALEDQLTTTKGGPVRGLFVQGFTTEDQDLSRSFFAPLYCNALWECPTGPNTVYTFIRVSSLHNCPEGLNEEYIGAQP